MEEERCMIEEPFDHWQWNDTGYLEGTQQDRRFVQAILLHDYMERVEVRNFVETLKIGLYEALQSGLEYHEYRENYSACQLYVDVLKRYEQDIEEFDQ